MAILRAGEFINGVVEEVLRMYPAVRADLVRTSFHLWQLFNLKTAPAIIIDSSSENRRLSFPFLGFGRSVFLSVIGFCEYLGEIG